MDMEAPLMATIKTSGIEIFSKQLETLSKEISNINSMALYDGAGVVADAIGNALKGLPVRGDEEWGSSKWKLYGATESEKQQLAENFGISRFQKGFGSVQTSVGFTGYVNTPSSRFNNQVPTGMLMQCIEYGTEFRWGTHTVTAAINKCRSKAEAAMKGRVEKEINELTK